MKLLIALLLLCPLVACAGAPDVPLSLEQAEQLWQNKNRELKLAFDQTRSANADKITAAQRPNPTLSFNTSSIEMGQSTFIKQSDSVVRIDQLVERGDKRVLRMREAEFRLGAAQQDYADAQRQSRIDLYTRYYDLVLAEEKLHIASENEQLFAKSMAAAQLRLKAGDLAGSDVARLQTDALRAQNDLDDANNNLHQAQNALAYWIGMEQEAVRLSAVERWPELQSIDQLPQADVMLTSRPDIMAADKRVKAAEAALAQAAALRTRDVTVGVQLEHNGLNRPINTVGVGISVPLMTGYAYSGEIERARVDLESAQKNAELARAKAAIEIDNARNDLLSAYAQAARFDEVLLKTARRALNAAEFGYQHGAAPLMDLLDAQRVYKSTQLDSANAHANYAKSLAAWRYASHAQIGEANANSMEVKSLFSEARVDK